jgi:hypothetical protein
MFARCHRYGSWALLLFLYALAAPASAEAWVVDSGPLETRDLAADLKRSVLGFAPEARVLRVSRTENGWSWKVRADGLADLVAAREVASILAQKSGSAALYVVEDDALREVEQILVQGSLPTVVSSTVASTPEPEAVAVDIEALLARVRRAHGGEPGLKELLEGAESVHFRFQREVPQGDGKLVVWHDYYRHKSWLRLEVRVLEGKGQSSLSVVRPETGAWVQVDEKTPEKLAPGRAMRALSAFAPSETMGRSVFFDQVRGVGAVSKTGSGELEVTLERSEGDVVLVIEPVLHRVQGLRWVLDGQESKWAYSDYREMDGGGLVPFSTARMQNGEVVERLSVLVLSISEKPDAALFDPQRAFK